MTLRNAICLSLVLASHAANASGTCASSETTNDKHITPNYDGVAESWNVARLDATGHVTPVTVYDYRKCAQSGDSGAELDGAIVANSLHDVVPSFEPDGTTGQYRVYAPDPAHANGKLLLYMSGQPDLNTGKDELLQRAAYLGYHVIATRYWNDADDATDAACGDGPDPTTGNFGTHSSSNPYTDTTGITYDQCVTRLHRNQFENWSTNFTTAHIGPANARCVPGSSTDTDVCSGTPTGNLLNNGDAAKYRFRALLTYLDQRHPADGWEQFSPDHAGDYDVSPYFDWSRVAVMGHSSGSKVAFYLQHDQADIDRVILLSGPNQSATRKGTTEPDKLASYVTTQSAVPHDRIYAFSNTHDPKFDKALASWRFMTGPAGTVGLSGASAAGGWESRQACTFQACPVCLEFRPVAPPAGSSIRAIQYSGNAELCLGKSSRFVPIDGSWAHESTTEDSSCSGSTPDTCWYLAIWDYMLTN